MCLWEAHGRADPQRGGRIRTLNTDMNVILLGGLYFSSNIVDLRERIEGLEILDVRGHEIDLRDLLVCEGGRATVQWVAEGSGWMEQRRMDGERGGEGGQRWLEVLIGPRVASAPGQQRGRPRAV